MVTKVSGQRKKNHNINSGDAENEQGASITRIGVVGAGVMGSGIAQRIASEGFEVVLVDTKPEFIENAQTIIRERVASSLERQTAVKEGVEQIISRIEITTNPSSLAGVQIVIESVNEEYEEKNIVLKNLDRICRNDTIIATSSSTWRISDLAKSIDHPERFLGLHFFYPAEEQRVVEIVRTEKTSDITLLRVKNIARMIGLAFVESADYPGFIVKRFLSAILNESVRFLNEGQVNIPTIDEAVCKSLGASTGPYAMMNARGIDLAEFASAGLVEPLGSMYAPPPRLKAQASSREPWNLEGDIDEAQVRLVADRFRGLLMLVGAELIDDDVASPEDIDLAVKLGLNWKKGPFELMNELGLSKSKAMVEALGESLQVNVPRCLSEKATKNDAWALRYVDMDIEGGVAYVTINRPDVLNALNDSVIEQINDFINKIEKDNTIKTIVFSGAGKVLSSGIESAFLLDRLEAEKAEDILRLYNSSQRLFSRIAALPITTVARADGLTLGGGVELGLACTYFIAGPRAVIGFPETGVGIHPGLGGTQRLPRKVGKSIGKYVLLTGQMLSANAALRLGIIDALAEEEEGLGSIIADVAAGEELSPEDAIPTDYELAAIALFDARNCHGTLSGEFPKGNEAAEGVRKALEAKAPIAITLVNKLIQDGLSLDLAKALKLEVSALELILQTKDAKRGLVAATTGQQPVFTGE